MSGPDAPPATPVGLPNSVEHAIDRIDSIYTGLMLVIFGAIPAAVALQMLTRWFLAPWFGIQIQWASALAQMLLIWVTFLGAGLASRDRDHISIEILFKRLPVPVARGVKLIQLLLVTWFLVVFMQGGLGMVDISGQIPFHTLPVTAPLTTAWVYRVSILGGAIMLVYVARDTILVVRYRRGVTALLRSGESDE